VNLVAYTDAESFGGAERSLATLLSHLERHAQVTVVGTTAPVLEAIAAERPGTRVIAFPPVRGKWDLLRIARHVAGLRALRPDVCHVNLRTPYACQYGLLAVILTPRVRLVAVEHLMLETSSPFRRRLKRWTSARLDAHVAVSEHTARLVERDAGLPEGSVSVIHNGVRGHATETPAEQPAPRPVIGSAGRLDRQKGFDVLIEALVLLDGVSAVVAGGGGERAALERLAREAGVAERFHLAGPTEEVPQLLRGLDVFVLSSRFEGLPLVLLEAMEAGLPIVATDVGGVAEAVTAGETALLVPPDDAPALAEAIRTLLEDPELRSRLGRRAHERWQAKFDVPVMVAAYERVYRGAS
jgi:glycosyltransferase involved in cell wall biosynthesis